MSVDSVIQETFEVEVPTPDLAKGEREYQAFLHLLPTLLPKYKDTFVAIHDGQVIDSDSDDIALIRRVHSRIGYVPIHVGLVTEQVSLVHVPHYRVYRPRSVKE
ncbi:MAG: hypothetical protein L0215_27885 [Gemmataceae bacterium]|nr:hypothetical protein [Gemmataceae bacterium]